MVLLCLKHIEFPLDLTNKIHFNYKDDDNHNNNNNNNNNNNLMLSVTKVQQSHYRPEVLRGFQEVKVPRLSDNGLGWW